MCGNVSDILVVLCLMKLVGMLESDGNKITKCDFDVTGNLHNNERNKKHYIRFI